MKIKFLALLLVSSVLLTSCASIVSKSNYPISINSVPSNAKITITDKKQQIIYTGNTPADLKLKASAGFFSKASYLVKYEKEGYEPKIVPINFKLDGWYIGNILFGGFIGWLIVDPATGAMYKLDTPFLNETLAKKNTTAKVKTNDQGLQIYSINDIPSEWRGHLVAISE